MPDERGSKHYCEICRIKFYDLLREPVECPVCGIRVEVYFSDSSDAGEDPDAVEDAIELDVSSFPTKTDGAEDGVIRVPASSGDALDSDDTVSLDEIKDVSTESRDQ